VIPGADGTGAGAAPSARIRELIRAGETGPAARVAADLIAGTFGLPVASAELTLDEYSLYSVSGRVRFEDGHTEFFKFHQEQGEEANVAEYYRGRLLADAGLPVELPLRVAGEPCRQIALYELRTEPRMSDVCLALERDGARLPPELLAARRELVTNLLAPTRAEPVRCLGLARAVMAGSEPVSGSDSVSRFLDSITPG
jgi:hypothetical protein